MKVKWSWGVVYGCSRAIGLVLGSLSFEKEALFSTSSGRGFTPEYIDIMCLSREFSPWRHRHP